MGNYAMFFLVLFYASAVSFAHNRQVDWSNDPDDNPVRFTDDTGATSEITKIVAVVPAGDNLLVVYTRMDSSGGGNPVLVSAVGKFSGKRLWDSAKEVGRIEFSKLPPTRFELNNMVKAFYHPQSDTCMVLMKEKNSKEYELNVAFVDETGVRLKRTVAKSENVISMSFDGMSLFSAIPLMTVDFPTRSKGTAVTYTTTGDAQLGRYIAHKAIFYDGKIFSTERLTHALPPPVTSKQDAIYGKIFDRCKEIITEPLDDFGSFGSGAVYILLRVDRMTSGKEPDYPYDELIVDIHRLRRGDSDEARFIAIDNNSYPGNSGKDTPHLGLYDKQVFPDSHIWLRTNNAEKNFKSTFNKVAAVVVTEGVKRVDKNTSERDAMIIHDDKLLLDSGTATNNRYNGKITTYDAGLTGKGAILDVAINRHRQDKDNLHTEIFLVASKKVDNRTEPQLQVSKYVMLGNKVPSSTKHPIRNNLSSSKDPVWESAAFEATNQYTVTGAVCQLIYNETADGEGLDVIVYGKDKKNPNPGTTFALQMFDPSAGLKWRVDLPVILRSRKNPVEVTSVKTINLGRLHEMVIAGIDEGSAISPSVGGGFLTKISGDGVIGGLNPPVDPVTGLGARVTGENKGQFSVEISYKLPTDPFVIGAMIRRKVGSNAPVKIAETSSEIFTDKVDDVQLQQGVSYIVEAKGNRDTYPTTAVSVGPLPKMVAAPGLSGSIENSVLGSQLILTILTYSSLDGVETELLWKKSAESSWKIFDIEAQKQPPNNSATPQNNQQGSFLPPGFSPIGDPSLMPVENKPAPAPPANTPRKNGRNYTPLLQVIDVVKQGGISVLRIIFHGDPDSLQFAARSLYKGDESSLSNIITLTGGIVTAPEEAPEGTAGFGLSSSSKKGGGCYSATASFAGYHSHAVVALTSFRDESLLYNISGSLSNSIYMNASVRVAHLLSGSSPASIVRILITLGVAMPWFFIAIPLLLPFMLRVIRVNRYDCHNAL